MVDYLENAFGGFIRNRLNFIFRRRECIAMLKYPASVSINNDYYYLFLHFFDIAMFIDVLFSCCEFIISHNYYDYYLHNMN